ncbi:hypothetical protein BU16DRAFT_592533 [Lophium mytilinum]|uniref:Uncharacterized protein n=1 Tax=Lophium mytilinum TaxID=390894 RepID=A0A6A6QLY0_9PEZI|nr:hypothetical protein BU16DRAFT_592533 [Lophium mytilinum]
MIFDRTNVSVAIVHPNGNEFVEYDTEVAPSSTSSTGWYKGNANVTHARVTLHLTRFVPYGEWLPLRSNQRQQKNILFEDCVVRTQHTTFTGERETLLKKATFKFVAVRPADNLYLDGSYEASQAEFIGRIVVDVQIGKAEELLSPAEPIYGLTRENTMPWCIRPENPVVTEFAYRKGVHYCTKLQTTGTVDVAPTSSYVFNRGIHCERGINHRFIFYARDYAYITLPRLSSVAAEDPVMAEDFAQRYGDVEGSINPYGKLQYEPASASKEATQRERFLTSTPQPVRLAPPKKRKQVYSKRRVSQQTPESEHDAALDHVSKRLKSATLTPQPKSRRHTQVSRASTHIINCSRGSSQTAASQRPLRSRTTAHASVASGRTPSRDQTFVDIDMSETLSVDYAHAEHLITSTEELITNPTLTSAGPIQPPARLQTIAEEPSPSELTGRATHAAAPKLDLTKEELKDKAFLALAMESVINARHRELRQAEIDELETKYKLALLRCEKSQEKSQEPAVYGDEGLLASLESGLSRPLPRPRSPSPPRSDDELVSDEYLGGFLAESGESSFYGDAPSETSSARER